MLVSFIIIARNAEDKIKNSLNSLLKQTYSHKNIEVILVDSWSGDSTRRIMTSFKNKHINEFSKIYVLDNQKRILPCGWNIALKKSSGNVIIRIDAHSTMQDDFVEKSVDLIKNGEMIVGGPRPSVIDENNDWQKTLLIAETSLFGSGIAAYRNSNEDRYVGTLAHAAYSRKVFQDVGGYDERLARTEDNEMHYRMKQAGYKFYFSQSIKSYHYARNSLLKMIKQKFFNGYWIGLTMGVCPKCFSIYHLVPLAFVVSLITSFALVFIEQICWPLIFILGLYFLANLGMTFLSIKKEKFRPKFTLLPLIFLILHLAYGVGTLIGLIKLPFWILDPENKKCREIENVKNIISRK